MIKEWLEDYNPQNEEEILFAMREIMQEVVLAGLSRTNFFEKAAFYGGTALRIFYGLDRFSEDLDFSLLEPDEEFTIHNYFPEILNEFELLGIKVSLQEKEKSKKSSINSAFLKTETLWTELILEDIRTQTGINSNKTIKIKIEIDRLPPKKFSTQEKLLLRPYSFYVKCFDPSSLFAGKLHALLFRKWKTRIKGRDWYDFEWYIKKGIPLNTRHFLQRAIDTNDWDDETISQQQIKTLIQKKIHEVSFSNIREDVIRFLKDDEKLKIWNPQYFLDLTDQIKIEK